jgi:hypothetical protein
MHFIWLILLTHPINISGLLKNVSEVEFLIDRERGINLHKYFMI